jgi:plastocyanin
MRAKAIFSVRSLESTAVFFGIIAVALLVAAVAKSRAAKPVIIIKMTDMPPSFDPTQITIKAGETVEWQNVGNQLPTQPPR